MLTVVSISLLFHTERDAYDGDENFKAVETVKYRISLCSCGANKYEGFLGNDLAMSDNCARDLIPCRLFLVPVVMNGVN